MGLHTGFLAVGADWPVVRPAIEAAFGPLDDDGAVSGPDWFDLPGQTDGINVAVAGGKTYIVDPRMVFTAWDDFTLGLSRALGCRVVAAGAETVSGTFWFLAAEAGSVTRWHWNVVATLTEPLDEGDSLPSEGRVSLEHPDGDGIFAALADLGFDPTVFMKGPAEGVRMVSRGATFPPLGELATRVKEHTEAHERADAANWQKTIRPVGRDDGGFDLRASTGRSGRSLVRRLFGRR